MDLAFKVQLSSVRAKQLHCPGRTAESFPLFRLNFDQKVVESELFQGAGDPEWAAKSTFEYRLREADLQSAIQSLQQRRAQLDVCFVDMRGGRETKVGSCSLDLYSICSGPHQMNFTLQSEDGSPAGSVWFSLMMEQQSTVSIEFKEINVSGLPVPAPYRLAYHFATLVGRDVESSVAQPTTNPQWVSEGLPKLEIRSTLRALIGSTVRVHVEDMQQRGTRIVVFDLPLRELITTNAAHSAGFKKNAYGTTVPGSNQANFAALATGLLSFSNLPILAQFERGENQQGNIHGKPLMPSCPLPPNATKVPKRLPDMRQGQAQFELAQHQSLLPDLANPKQVNAWGASVAPHIAHQPTPPTTVSTYPMQPQQPQSISHSFHQQQSSMQTSYNQQQQQMIAAPPPPPQYDGGYSSGRMVQSGGDDYYGRSYQVMTPQPPVRIGSPVGRSLGAMRTKSPLASAGENLIRQHQETVSVVELQQRRVQALAQELHERTVAEAASADHRARELEAEEQRVLVELRRIERTITEVQQMLVEHDAAVANAARKAEADRIALINELEDVTVLHLQVTELANQVSNHAHEDERIRERSRVEAESARGRFDTDTRTLLDVESRIQYRLGQPAPPSFIAQLPPPPQVHTSYASASHISTTSAAASTLRVNLASGSPSRDRRAEPRLEPRSISPPRHHSTQFGALHSVAPSLDVSYEAPRPLGGSVGGGLTGAVVPAMHSDVEDLLQAVRLNDLYRVQQILRRAPRAIFDDNNILHIACANSAPDFDIVSLIVHHRPELVNGVDTTTGSTALHLACNAVTISMPTVDLLLTKGASTTTLDNDGLNAFHVAVRNMNDASHNLKKLMLLKGLSDVNAPTRRGETAAHLVCTHDRYVDVLRFLVRYGANLHAIANIHNADNIVVPVTPLQKSRWFGPVADECRRFLEQGGTYQPYY